MNNLQAEHVTPLREERAGGEANYLNLDFEVTGL